MGLVTTIVSLVLSPFDDAALGELLLRSADGRPTQPGVVFEPVERKLKSVFAPLIFETAPKVIVVGTLMRH